MSAAVISTPVATVDVACHILNLLDDVLVRTANLKRVARVTRVTGVRLGDLVEQRASVDLGLAGEVFFEAANRV